MKRQASRKPFRLEAVLRSRASLHILGMTTPGTESAGAATLTLAIQDISDLRRAQRQAYKLERFDTLTGLPNRRQFLDTLAATLARASSALVMSNLQATLRYGE